MNRLTELQNRLKVGKSKYNSFGKFSYRSCEDILEAVKPLLKDFQATLLLTDDIVQVGDWVFVKATAALTVMDERYTVCGFARLDAEKKGMDAAQLTGSASSYARKYALNALLLIDDADDPDNPHPAPPAPAAVQQALQQRPAGMPPLPPPIR